MTHFVANYLTLAPEDARDLQKRLYHQYGTTLSGLMRDHNLDPHVFLAYVHDIDLSALDPDPELSALLGALPGRRLIYTNGSANHALGVTQRLGIDHLFHGVHDIIAAEFEPKPSANAFGRFLAAHDVDPTRAIFFEDSPHNLKPAHDAGMVTVWIDEPNAWSLPGGTGDHVHHRAGTLKSFLQDLLSGEENHGR